MTLTVETPPEPKPVERLFPFVLRARILIVGRETLRRSKPRLHFILIATDLSENSREDILRDFAHYPVVQIYSSADLETHFALRNTKVIGFKKSGLAQSIYRELKSARINTPPVTREHGAKDSKDLKASGPPELG